MTSIYIINTHHYSIYINMQYAHNLSFKESKIFIIFIIISAMILKISGKG